jgi:CspA family cold shock protein
MKLLLLSGLGQEKPLRMFSQRLFLLINRFNKEVMGMIKGKVKWFNNQKGYGFIVPDQGGADVFVHYSTIQGEGYKTLSPGDDVQFELIKGDKGEQAQNVSKPAV